MNKQEKEDLIQALYDIGGCEAEDEWARGYDEGVNAAIEIAKELKVQEKAIVPQVVADWIKYAKQQGYGFIQSYDPKKMFYPINDGLDKWIDDHEETFARAWLDGYEVEKEQLYYVVFDILHSQKYLVKNVKTNQFYLSNNEKVVGNYEQVRFTEQEIKEISQGYWYFKKEVEEDE